MLHVANQGCNCASHTVVSGVGYGVEVSKQIGLCIDANLLNLVGIDYVRLWQTVEGQAKAVIVCLEQVL